MIITIHRLNLDLSRLSWSQRELVKHLRRLHVQRGDVLLFSISYAIRCTGLKRTQVELGLAALAKRQAVAVEMTEAA